MIAELTLVPRASVAEVGCSCGRDDAAHEDQVPVDTTRFVKHSSSSCRDSRRETRVAPVAFARPWLPEPNRWMAAVLSPVNGRTHLSLIPVLRWASVSTDEDM
ncbi:hypothetical protein Hamer_G020673 [Homarus americanus]|uniref:Uncharacterized protein n=1 Tax=Homarus americanus TaxID=6706 RepID=A0A8J5JM05_HOMAM|nr:hypothetical protein Hamer_G020673 [Homarus americanus]